MLRKRGYEVLTAFDGIAALEQSVAFRPHIVFSDISLPQMDGLTLASRMRSIPELRDTVLVAITGYEDQETIESVELTFDHYLIKPPGLEAIESLVQAAMTRLDDC